MLRFFPAAGYRHYQSTGVPTNRARYGSYWSSSSDSPSNAWRVAFHTTTIDWGGAVRTFGNSIRCVAQKEFRNYKLLGLFFVLTFNFQLSIV